MNLIELLSAFVIIAMLSFLSLNIRFPRIPQGKLARTLIGCQLTAMQTMQECSIAVNNEQGESIEEKYNHKGRINHPCTMKEEESRLVIELSGGRIVEK